MVWSDQYDVKLQTAGLGQGATNHVVRGVPEEKQFSVWYLDGERLLAVDAINDPAAFAVGRKILMSAKPVSAAALADTQIDLKSLM